MTGVKLVFHHVAEAMGAVYALADSPEADDVFQKLAHVAVALATLEMKDKEPNDR